MVQIWAVTFAITTVAVLFVDVDAEAADYFFTGNFVRGVCEIQGLYPLDRNSFDRASITRQYSLGERWADRCSNCTCTPAGAVCLGPGQSCQHPYDFSLEHWCIEWSENGCCCEKLGCTEGEQKYALGAPIPYGDGNPCLTCACQVGATREHCLYEHCGVVELQCQDRTVTYDDNCCPSYHCPHGAFCEEIPDPFPDTPHHELLNWYGGQIDPIPLGVTQHYHLDSWTTYVCKCQQGGTADCEMRTFGMP